MKLIVGLGNPGREYAANRHNTGFMCVSYFARKYGIPFDKKQGKARVGLGEVSGNRVLVAKPQTYMNMSGESVKLLVKRYSIALDNLTVIHDDLDLPLGKIRIRQDGSAGGHKGIESIVTHLGSPDFVRLRIGIGRPLHTEDTAEKSDSDIIDYVLRDFTPEERQVITELMPRISEALSCLITAGLTAAMNQYN